MEYYKKLRSIYGGAAKIPKGWRLLRVGERSNAARLFVFSIKDWDKYEEPMTRQLNTDYSGCYITRK